MNKIITTVAMTMIVSLGFAQQKQNPHSDFIGKTFDYTIENFHLNLQILSDYQAKWTYVSAPDNQAGKTETENVNISKISKGIYQIYWTEKDGSNVVDIFNLKTNKVFVNFTLPDSKMYNYQTSFKIIQKK